MPSLLDPIPPGEILLEEFARRSSHATIGVNAGRISDIVHGRVAISPEIALRLSTYLGTSAEFWINLQSRYDLKLARREIGEEIRRDVAPLVAAE